MEGLKFGEALAVFSYDLEGHQSRSPPEHLEDLNGRVSPQQRQPLFRIEQTQAHYRALYLCPTCIHQNFFLKVDNLDRPIAGAGNDFALVFAENQRVDLSSVGVDHGWRSLHVAQLEDGNGPRVVS